MTEQNYCNLIVLTTKISSPIFSATHPEIWNYIFLSRNELFQTLITSTDTTCNLIVSIFISVGNPCLTLDLEICLVVNLISMTVNNNFLNHYPFLFVIFYRFFLRWFPKLIFQLNGPLLRGEKSEQAHLKMTLSFHSELPGHWAGKGTVPKVRFQWNQWPNLVILMSPSPTGAISNFP